MAINFTLQNLRRLPLQGKSLLGADLEGAGIRGKNFKYANLTGANLSHVRAGLRPEWSIVLKTSLLLLSSIASFTSAYIGAFISTAIPIIETVIGKGVAISLPVLLFFAFIGVTLWRGLGNAMWGFALAVTVAITITLMLPAINNSKLVFLFFTFVLAVEIAGVVAGALAIAATRILTRGWLVPLIIAAILFAIPLGIESGAQGTTEPCTLAVARIIALLTSLVLMGLSTYVGWQSIEGNPKYALIFKIAISFCNVGGTSFRGADLTEANFTLADLKHADFRGAILTRTRWFKAQNLEKARIDDTYLENPKIRQLVVTLNGQDQNFDHMDLRGLNLKGANLSDASFIGAKLSEANLEKANLDRAKLVQTQLYGANLTGASLTGAIIQDWSISTDTTFDGVKCDYIYMQLPTKADPDPCRKPDNRNEIFEEGDFADFIAPILRTLDLYQTQNVDLRVVAQRFKTLDLFHHEGIDPTAAAIALKQLSVQHPEAELEVVALEGRGDDKVRVQAKVAGAVDRSMLSAEYFTAYREISSLPYSDLQTLLAGIAEKDERIRSLENMVMTAIESNKFYVETYYNMGDTVSEKSAININSGGGNVSGVVGGNISDVNGVVNLGTISGDVTHAIGRLPDASNSDQPSLKALLTQLQAAIEAEAELSPDDKAEALEQVKTLAEAGQAPDDSALKKAAKTAIKVLKGSVAGLPEVTKLVQECTKLLPAIATLLVLV